MPGGFVVVGAEGDLDEGALVQAHVLGQALVLCRVGGRIFACSAECTLDEETDLTKGELRGFELSCPAHGCAYDVRSGRIMHPPAEDPLPTYEVRVEGGQILVAQRPRGY